MTFLKEIIIIVGLPAAFMGFVWLATRRDRLARRKLIERIRKRRTIIVRLGS